MGAHAQYKDLQEGTNADYIPAPAAVPSEFFSISLCTVDDKVYDVGDANYPFSIQSMSKVFTLAIAIQKLGSQAIVDSIGVNATGHAFNSVVAIEDIHDRPSNSCVNAGVIATTILLPGTSYDEKWNQIINSFSQFAARPLSITTEVYESEAASNQHNQAISLLLASYGRIYNDPMETVDLYTKQCSINVNSHDLAIMSGTLANGGINPSPKKN
ncbi:glutaminase [Reichenbachiella agarivorans]|uniref:glutaminase n=1 Tax=Reichenbachiella agarivorans TaxID=2979464 RepID=A0ABY6CTN4_9BACT|nr:glutaminase [Reichenbachiella agarivorans]UXP33858.1 glutaminase [Reichenbachiella agarivorans]